MAVGSIAFVDVAARLRDLVVVCASRIEDAGNCAGVSTRFIEVLVQLGVRHTGEPDMQCN